MISRIGKDEIPFVRFLFPFCVGITIGINFPVRLYSIPVLAGLFIGATVLLLSTFACYIGWKIYRKKWITGCSLFLFLSIAGFTLTLFYTRRLEPNLFYNNPSEVLLVRVVSEPIDLPKIIRFEVEVDRTFYRNRSGETGGGLLVVLLKNKEKFTPVHYGDLLLMPSNYTLTSAALNPKEFDSSKLLAYRAIYNQAFVSGKQLRFIKSGTGNPVIAYALRLRQKMVLRFNKFVPDRDAASLASALILGFRAGLDQEIVQAYAKTGTTHVLSVSGMHVGIVFIVLVFLLRFMDRTILLRVIRALLIVGLVIAYAVLTGLSSAVCRSAVMLIFVVIGKAVNRRIHNFNLLAVSAFLLLVYNPFFLADAGFQLSYLAVFGLFYLYPLFYECLKSTLWLPDKLWSCLAASCAAQLATLPVSLYYFHQFPVYFLLSNIFILLPVTAIMYLGILFLFIPWTMMLHITGTSLSFIIRFMNGGLFYLERLPGATLNDIWIGLPEVCIFYIAIAFGLLWLFYTQLRCSFGFVISLIFLAAFYCKKEVRKQQARQIVFYSLRNHTGIGCINGKSGGILTDLQATDAASRFSIFPYFSFCAIKTPVFVLPGSSAQLPAMLLETNYIQVFNTRILIVNKDLQWKKFRRPLIVDYLVLNGNPSIPLSALVRLATFRFLVIDGTNSDYHINQWSKDSKTYTFHVFLLKNHPAHIVNL